MSVYLFLFLIFSRINCFFSLSSLSFFSLSLYFQYFYIQYAKPYLYIPIAARWGKFACALLKALKGASTAGTWNNRVVDAGYWFLQRTYPASFPVKGKRNIPAACAYGLAQEITCKVLYVQDLRLRAMALAQVQVDTYNYSDQDKTTYFRKVSNIIVENCGLVFNAECIFNRLSPDLAVKDCPIRKQQGLVEFKSLFAGKDKTSFLAWLQDKDSTREAKVLQESKTEPGKLSIKRNHPWVQQCECEYYTYINLMYLCVCIPFYVKTIRTEILISLFFLCIPVQHVFARSTVGDVVKAEFVDLLLYLENASPSIMIFPITPDEEEWKIKKLFIEWITFNVYYPTLASPILVGDCVTRQLCTFPEFLAERKKEDENLIYIGNPCVHAIYTKKNFFDRC